MRRSATALALALALGALAGCGSGNDKKDAETTVRDFVKSVNDQDGKKFCNDLVSDSFLEGAFGSKGDDGKKQCEQQMKSLKPKSRIELVKIEKTSVKDKKATVKAVLQAGAQRQSQTIPLVKQGDSWRVSTLAAAGDQ